MAEHALDKDYDHLLDKQVICELRTRGQVPVLVKGIEYGVGITMVYADDPNEVAVCLPHPDTPVAERYVFIGEEGYRELFAYLVDAVEEGYINLPQIRLIQEPYLPSIYLYDTSSPDMEDCPFNQ